jgi:predicted nucleic acid-binding protein
VSAVFADTFYWIALTNKRDSAHRAVMDLTRRLAARAVVTSDEVLRSSSPSARPTRYSALRRDSVQAWIEATAAAP